MKSSTYYFQMKMKIMADFQICISILLKLTGKEKHNAISLNKANLIEMTT